MDHSHHNAHRMLHQAMVKRQEGLTTQDGTVVSVVYVTAEPTFTGVIGGYTTLTSETNGAASTSASGGQTLIPPAVASSSPASSFPGTQNAPSTSAQSAAFTSASSQSFGSSPNSFLTSASQSSGFGAGATNTGVSGASSTSPSDSSSSSSSGMSTGAKAGIAIGIIAIIGLIAALLLWFMGKKKREQEENARANDEKTTFGASQNAVPLTRTPTSANAPRLSLRPMSRMMDSFMGHSNRRSGGNLLNTISENGPNHGTGRNMTPSPQPRGPSPMIPEKPEHENPFADPQNPFADPAPAQMRQPPPAAIAASQQSSQPRTKFNPNSPLPNQPRPMDMGAPRASPAMSAPPVIAPLVIGAAAGAAAMGAAAIAKSRPPHDQAQRQAQPQRPTSPEAALPVHQPSSPEQNRDNTVSPNPDSAPMPPNIAGAMPSPAPSGSSDAPGGNVYRVLMDFAPSMDDELALKTGQLVRMLHEYDDGWALCIKLDRSQQGVVPRTCLAAKPSKPKPSHLAQYARGAGPGGRPMSPAGMQPRGQSPAMGRPMSPAGMQPRGQSPAMGRPMSPAGMGRPQSPGMGRPMSPGMGRPMSPGGRPRNGPPPRGQRPFSPEMQFNQAPRPLSPGPRPQKRSQSPGPYGANGPMPMPGMQQRRRSNSASNALNPRDQRMPPPGPSNLGPQRPMAPGMAPYRPMSPGIAM